MTFRPPDLRDVPLPYVHVDPRFVVVDKPSGLLSVPAKDPTILDHVKARVKTDFPQATGPMSVHRLDMETSGLLLVALDPEAHRDLSLQFSERRVDKRYAALVAGGLVGERGRVDLPLRLDPDRRPLQVVDPDRGRAAVTEYAVRCRRPEATLLALRPLTGRTHQLRVHCAHGLGCPILGDRLYGDPSSAPRLMLHAERLSFEHPTTYARVEVESPAPFG